MLSILISSTFNDMQAERDVIHTRVAPALRRVAARYGQSVRLIDLRWGVNTADMSEKDAAQKVLETCLNEIDRCDGYMICLLGNRYGWIPDYTNLTTLQEHRIDMPHPVSVTELEIQYGILQRNNGEKSVIFLRDEITALPDELRSRYSDPADDHRMAALKARLEELPKGNCEHYSLEYGADGEFLGINSFAERLTERAAEILHKVFGSQCTLNEAETLKRKFDNIIAEHCETYLPNPVLEREIHTFAAGTASVLMLQGPEGSGRTALVCRLSESPPAGVRVIPYFCAGGSGASAGQDILSYFIGQLESGEDIQRVGKSSQRELEEYFSELISNAETPIWFAVDGLEMLGGDEKSRLSWIPQNLPPNVRLVFTSVKGDIACNQLGESFHVQYCDMPTMPDTVGFIRAGLATAGKAVPDAVLSKIAEHPLSTNYLFCDMVIRMLMLIDRHDFAVMNRDGGGINAINSFILTKINHLPETMAEMAFLFLYDCGEQIAPGNAAAYLSAIAQAPMGLRAQDLQALFPHVWDEADFSCFTAFLDGFLVCGDNGCYTFSSALMQDACLRVAQFDLAVKIASYFSALPDNDPVKAGSALPMFLIHNMHDQAAALILANPHQTVLYTQIWNMTAHTRAAVSALWGRDDVLELFLENAMDLCDDVGRLAMMADIFASRVLPGDAALQRRMLLALAQIQMRLEDKRSACRTFSALLPLEDTPLSRAKTIVRITACSFVDHDGQRAEIARLLDEALTIFTEAESLSSCDYLLRCEGLFYRHLLSMWDAYGADVGSTRSYGDFIDGKRSSSVAYMDTLTMVRLSSVPFGKIGADVFRVLIRMCDLGQMIQSRICAGNEHNTDYARLLLTLLNVMSKVDSPANPFDGELPPDEAHLLTEFRALRASLVTVAHATALTALHGRYDAPMLKILAFLQIHLAYFTDEQTRRRSLLEQSSRILWRYFSSEPLSDFADKLAESFLALAECCLEAKDTAAYEQALEKWVSVAMSVSRHAIRIAKEQCRRYPDEVHEKALLQARRSLTSNWTEYAERLWLQDLYRFVSNTDLILALYRNNNRNGIPMVLPANVINIRAALVLIKKMMEMESRFGDETLSDLHKMTLPAAFHSLLTTTLQVVLLSEQNISEDSGDPLSTPQFYYPKTAAFVESYIRRCRERELNLASDKALQLSFCLAQLKLKSVPYCEDNAEDELSEVLILLDALMDSLPAYSILPDWLFDEVSADSVRLLQCRAYLMLGDLGDSAGDEVSSVVCYRRVCALCARLYGSHTASAAQTAMAIRFLRSALPPLLAYYENLGSEDTCRELLDLYGPFLGG